MKLFSFLFLAVFLSNLRVNAQTGGQSNAAGSSNEDVDMVTATASTTTGGLRTATEEAETATGDHPQGPGGLAAGSVILREELSDQLASFKEWLRQQTCQSDRMTRETCLEVSARLNNTLEKRLSAIDEKMDTIIRYLENRTPTMTNLQPGDDESMLRKPIGSLMGKLDPEQLVLDASESIFFERTHHDDHAIEGSGSIVGSTLTAPTRKPI